MDKELQKLAIVRACQWERRQEGANVWYEKDGKPVAHHNTMLNDLNASAAMEDTLENKKVEVRRKYMRELRGVTAYGTDKEMVMATATQRAEAFLRTLNLWTPTGEENE